MAIPLSELKRIPDPQYVFVADGTRLATYSWGDPDDDTVLIVHGFASNTRDTWVYTGWIPALEAAGFRVLGIDLRGHGASEKPHDADGYTVRTLAADIETVMDTHLIDSAVYLGYSLGARVGWEVARDLPHRIDRAVLGGVPDGIPLERLDLEQVRAYIANGTEVTDPDTKRYIRLTERVRGNDLRALLALAEGMRASRTVDPDPATAPPQPILIATGARDTVIDGSRRLAEGAPQGRFVEIPDRHHFNAPGSRDFRDEAIAFFAAD